MLKGDLETKLRRGDLTYLSAMIIMVIMPLHYKYLPPFMILMVLCWIYENYSRFHEIFISHSRSWILFIVFLVFYFWQAIGILYSSDLKIGWSNIFGRLSFILFPLVLFEPGEKIKANSFKLLKIFVLSTSFYILTCYVYALFRSLSLKEGIWIFYPHPPDFYWQNYFYNADFTYSIHPSYVAMYVIISVFIAFESLTNISLKVSSRIFWLIICIFLITSVYFISSRAALLALVIMIPFYSITKIIIQKKSKYIWIGVIVILILMLPLIYRNDRVNNFFQEFSNEQKSEIRMKDERIVVWESAIRLIRNNLVFGVGIGDVRTTLISEYKRIGEAKLEKEGLNAHNQFLEILLENGLIGILIFLSVLGYMSFIAISENNLLYGLFILMMIVFFMFETILYRLAGISFFSTFSFLLLYISKSKNINS